MSFGRIMLMGLIYGLGFMLVKGLFPEPFVLLLFQNADSSDGNLSQLAIVYMLSGLVAGLITAPVYAAFLTSRRRNRESRAAASGSETPVTSYGTRFTLSIVFGVVMGVVSALLILLAYATGILQGGGVLDPLGLIGSSNFAPGTPLLVAWTIFRDVLPAGLTGLFLAPIGGDMLQKLYAPTKPVNRDYDWDG